MHDLTLKMLLRDHDALLKGFDGIEAGADMVAKTMGSHGRMVLIDKGRFNEPVFSRDGVSVAKEIGFRDPVQNTAWAVVFEASKKTNEEAGDGTTCAIVLAKAMIEEGMRHVLSRRNVIRLQSGMLKTAAALLVTMGELTKQVDTPEELVAVTTISAQSKEIGEVIAAAIEKVGADGSIITDIKSGAPGVDWTFLEGMRIERGFYSPFFITDTQRLEYNETGVYVLACGDSVSHGRQVAPLFDALLKKHREEGRGAINCLVIAPNFTGEGLKFFLQNKMNGILNPVLVRSPLSGKYMRGILEDIAIKTGGVFHYSEDGNPLPEKAEKADVASFGFADRVVVTEEETTIIGGLGNERAIAERAELLRSFQKKEAETFDREEYGARIARLTSGVGLVRVSAQTEAQTEELRFRVEDALCAAKAALAEGTVPGGGVALLRAAQLLTADKDRHLHFLDEDEQAGAQIVLAAVRKPAWQIATNAGESGDVVVHEILRAADPLEEKVFRRNLSIGYNLNMHRYEDLRAAGIIDPAKAIRCSLQNAVGVASAFLTQGGAIVHEKEPQT